MPKIFLSEVPCTEDALADLGRQFPEVDSYSLFTYLKVRKVSSDLDNALESYFASHGVSAGRFMLLMLLNTNPAGMMPSELAQHCGVTQATISGLLNGLEKGQLIHRETHNHDGRAYVIKLSDKGLALLNRVRPEFLGCVDGIMGKYSAEEKKILIDLMSRLGDEIKSITELKAARLSAAN